MASHIPTHPRNSAIRCATCKYWHPGERQKMVLTPEGKLCPAKLLPTEQHLSMQKWWGSVCFYDPAWQITVEDHYCAHHSNVEKLQS